MRDRIASRIAKYYENECIEAMRENLSRKRMHQVFDTISHSLLRTKVNVFLHASLDVASRRGGAAASAWGTIVRHYIHTYI